MFEGGEQQLWQGGPIDGLDGALRVSGMLKTLHLRVKSE
jgi:hypothetical protein